MNPCRPSSQHRNGPCMNELVITSAAIEPASTAAAPENHPAVLYLSSLGSAESRRVMQSRMNRFASFCRFVDWRSTPWQEMDRSWLLLAKECMTKENCAPDTINAMLSMLKGVALQAWELQMISDHCYLRIKNTKGVRGSRVPKRRWLNKDEMRALLDKCITDDRKQGSRDAALIALLYGCGLRRSEVVSIDLNQLNFSEQSIRIIGKGNKERKVYPPARAWELLQEWIKEADISEGPLFRRIYKGGSVSTEHLTDQSVYFILKRLIVMTGIADFTPHDLRGSFISCLLDTGNDIKTVADIVGHSDIRTTARYDRRGEKRKKITNRSLEL